MRASCNSAHSRGFLVTNPTIPGIVEFPLGILRRCWESEFVPGVAKVTSLGEQWFGEPIHPIKVQAQPAGGPTQARPWHIKTGPIDPLKRVAFLKIAQTTALLL